jgi:hypothetical protein
MKKLTWPKKISVAFYLLGIFWFCHHFIFRPIFLDWGATKEVRDLDLSGDIFTSGDRHTRAVLISATPEEIWPWLVQIGQERGGFYSHEWLENLFFANMKNTYSIEDRFQHRRTHSLTVIRHGRWRRL